MLSIDLKPGIGAGTLLLEATREESRKLMDDLGYPLAYENGALDYFCENSIQLEYENNHVRFIGISDHEEIKCTYYGQDVFDIEAKELFAIVAKNEPVTPEMLPGETCFFPNQGINLWEADEQYDRKGGYKRPVYAQVGIESPEGSK